MTSVSKNSPHPFDVEVGQRVAFRRRELSLSQGDLGRGLGLTFQQIQKYERGANRISASKLFEMSKMLDVSCGWLMGEDGAPSASELPATEESKAHKMLSAWRRLDAQAQDALLAAAKSLAGRPA
jgi:transcriptional regulator with XRE-family HTH domain